MVLKIADISETMKNVRNEPFSFLQLLFHV